VNGPGKLLGTVCFIQYVVSQRLQVREVRAECVSKWGSGDLIEAILEQSGAETAEVRVLGVVDFRIAPRVDTSADELAVDLNFLLRANDGEGEEVL